MYHSLQALNKGVSYFTGNNFYDDGVCTILNKIRHTSERDAYILMDRVHPPTQSGLVLWQGKNNISSVHLTSELGILGVFLRSVNGAVQIHYLVVLYKHCVAI